MHILSKFFHVILPPFSSSLSSFPLRVSLPPYLPLACIPPSSCLSFLPSWFFEALTHCWSPWNLYIPWQPAELKGPVGPKLTPDTSAGEAPVRREGEREFVWAAAPRAICTTLQRWEGQMRVWERWHVPFRRAGSSESQGWMGCLVHTPWYISPQV